MLHNVWKDYFSSSIKYKKYRNTTENFSFKEYQNYYVSCCLFIYLNKTGAIRINDDSTSKSLKFLIDTSEFDKCGHQSLEGGSLYVSFYRGECVQDRIYSFGSKTPNSGAYCNVRVDVSKNKNYLLDSTISSSGDGNTVGYDNVKLESGEVYMKSINISYSKLEYRNLYNIWGGSNSNITHSTFSNNTAANTGNNEAEHSGYSENKILFCNFFENEGYSFISSQPYLYIINCSFNKNTIRSYYFKANNGPIQIQRCYLDNPKPATLYSVEITEKVDSIYPENIHSSFTCSELKLETEKSDSIQYRLNFKYRRR